jgi:O-antigen ligase
MMLPIVILYFILFCLLAQKNFKMATGLLIILLPSYFVRFNIGPLPSTILEISFGALFLVWLIKYFRQDVEEIRKFYREQKSLVWLVCLLLSFSTLGIFISWEPVKSLGVWRAYFLEPILFFVLLIGRRHEIKKEDLILYLSLSTVIISIVAILQQISGQPILTTLIKSDLQGRATSFFTTPNAIGLYIAPIIPLIIYGIKTFQSKKRYLLIFVLAVIAIALSQSEGAAVALGFAIVVSLFLLGYKKIVSLLVLLGILAVLLITPVQQSLLFKNQSGKNRLTLWEYTWTYLNKKPTNFIFGAGMSQFFRKIQRPVNDFKVMESQIFPHNIILNFWSEIGVFGMLFFFAIYTLAIKLSWKIYKKEKYLGVAFLMCLLVYFVHGLVDVPYFKNDLSFLWWIILAIISI